MVFSEPVPLSIVCWLNGGLTAFGRSLMWLWNINQAQMRGHLWYWLFLWNALAFASKPAELKKQRWAMSANINLSVPEGPKTTCYIPRHLQAVGEEVEAIYGCFRGLSNTPSASFLSRSLESPGLYFPFSFCASSSLKQKALFPACSV